MTRINCGALQMINLVLNITAQTHDCKYKKIWITVLKNIEPSTCTQNGLFLCANI
jgi:hypothetical protein